MTREELVADLAQYTATRDQLRADFNAVHGVVQYIEQKIQLLDQQAMNALPTARKDESNGDSLPE